MRHLTGKAVLAGVVLIACTRFAASAEDWLSPALPEPAAYGNLLMNRVSTPSGQPPVTFSHWSHRRFHTCRVCHFELEFAMEVNATEITEEMNRNGLYCGACHDGKTAFGHVEGNCRKCHNGDITYGKENFDELSYFPESPYGNKVDWVQALNEKRISPKASLYDEDYAPMEFDSYLELKAEWTRIPPAVFPHDVHNQWLDCANCHPDIFNIKKKTTEHFAMEYIMEERFCGVCHLRTAFPIDNCKRCHPAMKE
jgi:c(7)-type cytochrome triheme protein